MLFERVGDILILVHGTEAPSDGEWQSYVSAVHLGLHNDPPLTGCLVTTRGGAPNAGQRKVLHRYRCGEAGSDLRVHRQSDRARRRYGRQQGVFGAHACAAHERSGTRVEAARLAGSPADRSAKSRDALAK